MPTETSVTLTLDSRDEAVALFGSRDQFLRLIREALGVRIVARGDVVHIDGNDFQVDQADRVFQQLRQMLKQQGSLTAENVRTVLAVVTQSDERQSPQNLAVVNTRGIDVGAPNRHLAATADWVISNGYAKLKDLTFRIGHMGDHTLEECEELTVAIDRFLT